MLSWMLSLSITINKSFEQQCETPTRKVIWGCRRGHPGENPLDSEIWELVHNAVCAVNEPVPVMSQDVLGHPLWPSSDDISMVRWCRDQACSRGSGGYNSMETVDEKKTGRWVPSKELVSCFRLTCLAWSWFYFIFFFFWSVFFQPVFFGALPWKPSFSFL